LLTLRGFAVGVCVSLTQGVNSPRGIIGGPGDGTPDEIDAGFAWDAHRLCYTVREPFPSRTSGARLVHGWVEPEAPLRLVSHLGGAGLMFGDGVESDALGFNTGMVAEISITPPSRAPGRRLKR
jgi:hypothetical protein